MAKTQQPARSLSLGIAHHLGWAVAVTALGTKVVDRRRIELLGPEVPPMPVEHEIDGLDDAAAAALVRTVRQSAERATASALDQLAAAIDGAISSISLRAWPLDFPQDIATQRRPPFASQADSVMYRQVLAEAASARGWSTHLYDAAVESQAANILGDAAHETLYGPRLVLGSPWTKDHRMALAAAILAGVGAGS